MEHSVKKERDIRLKMMLNDLNLALISFKDIIDGLISKVENIQRDIVIQPEEVKKNLIINEVLTYFGISFTDLKARSRKIDNRWPRQILAALLSDYTYSSLNAIGKEIERDHTTVLHSKKVVSNFRDTNDPKYSDYDHIERKIQIKLSVLGL